MGTLDISPSLAMISTHNPSTHTHLAITALAGYYKITSLNVHAMSFRTVPERQLARIQKISTSQ
jgi:hypothetical protein